MDIISAIASFNALIIAFIIYSKKSKLLSDKILFAWILNFAFHFVIPLLMDRQILMHESNWAIVLGIFFFAHAPFILVYTNSLTNRNFKANFKNLYHFGFVLLYLTSFIPYLLMSYSERDMLIYGKQNITYQVFLPMIILLFCQIYFLIRTIILLAKHEYSIKHEFSFEKKINLTWLKYIAYGFFSLIVLSFIAYAMVSSKLISINLMDEALIVANMILFFYIAYYGYKQKSIYPSVQETILTGNNSAILEERPIVQDELSSVEQPTTIENSVSEDEQDPKIKELLKIMLEEKLYLEPELNIGALANQLNIHSHQLSKLINTQLNKNFFEFVNNYRIEEFKKLVADPKNKHFSILGLAIDAGFNSKATFNRFFKNSTGLTPSEFRGSYKF
jgi:AraC-like DNA-binding protein